MIPCPHADCLLDLGDEFTVTTLYGTTGPRMYVECEAGHRSEVDVTPLPQPVTTRTQETP